MSNEAIFQLGVKALIQNEAGEVLLLRTDLDKHVGDNTEAFWDLPGGRVQEGDTIEETLRREVLEESGITDVRIDRLIGTFPVDVRLPHSVGQTGLLLSVYSCVANGSKSIRFSEEHSSMGWYSLEEAIDRIKDWMPESVVQSLFLIQEGENFPESLM